MLVLIGKAGTGKSSVYNEILENYNFSHCVKFTTRKPRKSETTRSEYVFVDDMSFKTLSEHNEIAFQEYFVLADKTKVSYGYDVKGFYNDNKDKVAIMSPKSLDKLVSSPHYNQKDYCIYELQCPFLIRYERLCNRGDSIDEIKRRIDADEIDFRNCVNTVPVKQIHTEKFTIKTLASYIVEDYFKNFEGDKTKYGN